MNMYQRWTVTMLEDVLATAQHFAPPDPQPAGFSDGLEKLQEVVRRIHARAVAQRVDLTGTQRTHADARAALRQQLKILRAVAMGSLANTPNAGDVRRIYRIPKAGVHQQTLLTAARSVAAHAALHPDVFIANGQPAEFLAVLARRIEAVSETSEARTTTRADRTKATEELTALCTEGRGLVRGLNGVMHTVYATVPEVLNRWVAAMRIRRPRAALEGASPTPPPIPANRTTPKTASPVAEAVAHTEVTAKAA